ncbi:radical SAM family heme chaperone HemW [Flavobacteriales bacterium]|nr:radical SAM family heme chaperone HemW [Flavobacteriales bacterium]
MAGIYIHIPFCKKACSYCNFHFSTSLILYQEMINAIKKEVILRSKNYNDEIETIYFGGGTPSLLKIKDIDDIFLTIENNYNLSNNIEITIEANPDDFSKEKLKSLSKTKINRISLGVQTLNDDALKLMRRVHSSKQSIDSIENSLLFFKNISIDLIYGIPNLDINSLDQDLRLSQYYDIKHISTYALTVESKTLLESQINKNLVTMPQDGDVYKQYMYINNFLSNENYENYEMNSYAKNGFYSRNNSGYWLRKKYIGIGPSAHSFDGFTRSWNISNNSEYIKGLKCNKLNVKREVLSKVDIYNEYVMTGLRTIWGVSSGYISKNFGKNFYEHFMNRSQSYLKSNHLVKNGDLYTVSKKGKFLTDGIAAELFLIKLK